MAAPFTTLENIIGHTFHDQQLLRTALTHSSAGHQYNYERMEFLGDRILGLIIAEMLYKQFPQEPEGDLAKRLAALVQGSFLAKRAHDINLGTYIQFSEAERIAGGSENDNILADVFESMIGALYLDGGFEPCRRMIENLWSGHLHEMKAPPQHPKTTLQEWAQSNGLPLPLYEVAGQDGPDHAPVFRIKLVMKGHEPVYGEGKSRQVAEKQAAKKFLSGLES